MTGGDLEDRLELRTGPGAVRNPQFETSSGLPGDRIHDMQAQAEAGSLSVATVKATLEGFEVSCRHLRCRIDDPQCPVGGQFDLDLRGRR